MTTHEYSTEVLVVGAGPVGLFAALCAAQRGLGVTILDQTWHGLRRGHATVLHPRSLKLLEDAGISESLFVSGRTIKHVGLEVNDERVATLELPAHAIAVGQNVLEQALLDALAKYGVKIHTPVLASSVEQDERGVAVRVARRELVNLGSPIYYRDWEPAEESVIRARYVIGADGYDSCVRSALGIDTVTIGSTETYAIFEYASVHGGDDMVIGLHDTFASATLLLPHARTRFACQLADGFDQAPDLRRFKELASERAPFFANDVHVIEWGAVTHFERRHARSFGRGRVWLAGDAAHVTSPLGGHSMNGGLFEAHDLVSRIADCAAGRRSLRHLEHFGAERLCEWRKLHGIDGSFDVGLEPPPWLAEHAHRLLPSLPLSEGDLRESLGPIGLGKSQAA